MNRRTFLLTPVAAQAVVRGADSRTAPADILGAALSDEQGWERLEYLCYRIGNRLSGSESLARATEWAADLMREDAQDNVRLQPVSVPHWERGEEHCFEIQPANRELRILGLGTSVGTPPDGIEADLVVVASFDDLDRLGRAGVEGKIVLYNAPFTTYGETVAYRSDGASRAASLGAVAALVRSVTPLSLSTPHTGGMNYAEGADRIPAAAITIEDAERYAALYRAGVNMRVRLQMGARTLPDADSANVIGEIEGSESPGEIVVFGGHIDSWDVGQGAHDDGAACVASIQALNLIRRLGLRPRRTLRVALWTNEENGLRGGRAYREALGDDVSNHVAAVEMDGGCERPIGFRLAAPGLDDERRERALSQARSIASALSGIGADSVAAGGGEADIGSLISSGVPGFSLATAFERYFEWHHTDADTLDKIDPMNFRHAVAALGVFCYGLADMQDRLVAAG